MAGTMVMLFARLAQADQAAHVVRVVGDEAVLEVYRDDWVPLCHSPCSVALRPDDATRSLRVRSPSHIEEVHVIDGELFVDVTDHRAARTGLVVAAGVLVTGAVVMFGVAFYKAVDAFELPIGCDDFSGTPDAGNYPNGKTCTSKPSHAGPFAGAGLGLLAAGAVVGVIAITLPSSKIRITPAVGPHDASATLSWRF